MNKPTPVMRHLKKLRLERGLTQKDVADRMHYSREAICQMETGARKPLFESVLAYCVAIGARIQIALDNGLEAEAEAARLRALLAEHGIEDDGAG